MTDRAWCLGIRWHAEVLISFMQYLYYTLVIWSLLIYQRKGKRSGTIGKCYRRGSCLAAIYNVMGGELLLYLIHLVLVHLARHFLVRHFLVRLLLTRLLLALAYAELAYRDRCK